jgi:hypothetical protein
VVHAATLVASQPLFWFNHVSTSTIHSAAQPVAVKYGKVSSPQVVDSCPLKQAEPFFMTPASTGVSGAPEVTQTVEPSLTGRLLHVGSAQNTLSDWMWCG